MINRLLLIPSFLSILIINGSVHANNPWVLSKQADGISVYLRDTPNSLIKSFKGVVTMPSKLTPLVAVLGDTSAYTTFLHECIYAKPLKTVNNKESYKYLVTNMPWPVKDRDTVVHSILTQNKNSKEVEIRMQAAPEYTAIHKNYVRITKMKGRWLLTPTGKGSVVVAYEMSVDPAGNLPSWLVNVLSIDIPFNTLKKLRILVNKPLYQQAELDFIVE